MGQQAVGLRGVSHLLDVQLISELLCDLSETGLVMRVSELDDHCTEWLPDLDSDSGTCCSSE